METKNKIIDAAVMMFGRYGYDSVSLREVAFEAGINRSTLYNYFPSKEDLLDGIVDFMDQRLDHYEPEPEEIVEQLGTLTPQALFTRFTAALGRDYDNPLLRALYRLVYMEQYRSEKISAAAYEHFVQRPTHSLQTTIDAMVGAGAIPPCDSRALAELWVRMALVYGMQVIHQDSAIGFEDYRRVCQLFVDILVRGVEVIPVERIDMTWHRHTFWEEVEPEKAGGAERVLFKALELFSQNGYTDTSISHIARESGVGEREIYGYFSSKGAIMQQIIATLLGGARQFRVENPRFQAVLVKRDPQQVILDLADTYPPLQGELVLKLYRLLFREQYYNEELKDFFVGSIYRDCDIIEHTLNEMIGRGRIQPCPSREISVAYVHAMCSYTIESAVFPNKDKTTLEKLRMRSVAVLVSLIVNGYRQ